MYELIIKHFAPHDWNGLIDGCNSVGNTYEMGKFNTAIRVMPLFVMIKRDKQVIAKWLIYKRRFEPIKVIRAYTFPDVAANENYENVFSFIIQKLSEKYEGYKLQIESYTFARNESMEILQKNSFKNIRTYTTYISEIVDENELIISGFRKTHKQDTKKAIKEGYQYKSDIPIEEYYKLSIETYSRSNQKPSMSLKRLKRFKQVFINSGIISGVYVDGELQAASVIPFTRGGTAVYYHGASTDQKSRGVTTYLQYMNMVFLRDNFGVKSYDFTGTSIELVDNEVMYTDEKASSLDQFKRRFGGVQQIHYSGDVVL